MTSPKILRQFKNWCANEAEVLDQPDAEDVIHRNDLPNCPNYSIDFPIPLTWLCYQAVTLELHQTVTHLESGGFSDSVGYVTWPCEWQVASFVWLAGLYV